MECEIATAEAIYWVITLIQYQVYGCLVLFTFDNLYKMLIVALWSGSEDNVIVQNVLGYSFPH
jgi:hypothetical protein